MKTNIFIDTEFTDLENMDLISIGLVSTDGRQFYAERDDFDVGLCSEFVRSNVLPLLRAPSASVMSNEALKPAVASWIASFEAEGAVICFDHVVDWALLWYLYDKNSPKWLGARNIKANLDLIARENFFVEAGLVQHHALNDAKANRYSMMTDSSDHPRS